MIPITNKAYGRNRLVRKNETNHNSTFYSVCYNYCKL